MNAVRQNADQLSFAGHFTLNLPTYLSSKIYKHTELSQVGGWYDILAIANERNKLSQRFSVVQITEWVISESTGHSVLFESISQPDRKISLFVVGGNKRVEFQYAQSF
jgi:hypothetical protein